MASAVNKLCALLVFVVVFAGNASAVSDKCLRCLCRAVSNCNYDAGCNKDVCGPYHITWGYWADAGKPTTNGLSPDHADAYASCAKDLQCADRTVKNYMDRYAHDCNGDGRVDCYDYMAIHHKGRYGCSGELPEKFNYVFKHCFGEARISKIETEVEVEYEYVK